MMRNKLWILKLRELGYYGEISDWLNGIPVPYVDCRRTSLSLVGYLGGSAHIKWGESEITTSKGTLHLFIAYYHLVQNRHQLENMQASLLFYCLTGLL